MVDVITEFTTYPGCHIQQERYQADGSLALELWNEEDGPIARLTTCLLDRNLAEDEAYIDLNNCPWAMPLIEKYGLGKPTGRIGHSGYCTYPVVKFDMDVLAQHE